MTRHLIIADEYYENSPARLRGIRSEKLLNFSPQRYIHFISQDFDLLQLFGNKITSQWMLNIIHVSFDETR